jgi:2'-5' RNA ligase
MRRRGIPFRPRAALLRRAVVAFPAAGALDDIEAFRHRHDPMHASIDAHVTLVFPFASTLSALQIATHVRKVSHGWPPLPIRLEGVGAYTGEWVHLRVTRGRDAIVELHDRLYRRALAHFLRREFDYEPHLTIARANDAGACDEIVAAARAAFRQPLDAVLRSLTIVAVHDDGRVVREADVGLGA